MTRAFISYSHVDADLRAELEKHLRVLKRQGLLDFWSDRCIDPGEDLDESISAELAAADLFLPLISIDFLDSYYCSTVEMTHALQRHVERSAIVVPIILRPCAWKKEAFGGLKALPSEGKAVAKWPSLDDAFTDIINQLQAMLERKATEAKSAAAPASRAEPAPAARVAGPSIASARPRSSNLALPKTFNDVDRHDFLEHSFGYIQNFFENSLQELEARNKGITTRLMAMSPTSFKVTVFKDGKRVAGCTIRSTSSFGFGIAYSGNENAADNSYNEMMSVGADENTLYLTAGMAMFHGGSDPKKKLTDEGAAEHLWSMLLRNFRQ